MAWTVELFPDGSGNRRAFLIEASPNDSNKSLTFDDIGEGSLLRLDHVRVELVTSATGGTRTLILELLDAAGNVEQAFQANNTSIANTTRKTQFWPTPGFNLTAQTEVSVEHFAMHVWLARGHSLRVRDLAAIDAAADDMTVKVQGLLI